MWMTSSEASVEPNAKSANDPISEGGPLADMPTRTPDNCLYAGVAVAASR